MAHIEQFDRIIKTMPMLLEKLQSSPALSREGLPELPSRGIYVFYEDGKPIYVGRSKRMRTRLLEHSRPSSGHTSATFAFILAQEKTKKQGLDVESMQRKQLENTPKFQELYRRAKDRVSRMTIRVVQVDDPIEQTVFEVYAALALETPYNVFETH